jgi:hypothetical protein
MLAETKEGFLTEWSDILEDQEWDEFLLNNHLGEFQQSSMWARVKNVEGWSPYRYIFKKQEKIIGGFQILWKKTRVGRIGYISRGPVAPEEGLFSKDSVLDEVIRAVKIKKINALIIQPSSSVENGFPVEKYGLIPNNLIKVVTSTIRVDVSDGVNGFEKRMNPNTRRIIRQSEKKGVKVREGGKDDIELFFWLMEASCRRQGANPNPPTVSSFEEVWLSFSSLGCCRLTIAEFEGKPISGLLCIPFGKVVHLWKKGSLQEFLHLHPMDLLYYEAFCWASQAGYEVCDFEEMVDSQAAEKIIKGEPISVEEIHPRDRIHLRFGGKPYLMQDSYLLIPNIFIRYFLSYVDGNKQYLRIIKKFIKDKQ